MITSWSEVARIALLNFRATVLRSIGGKIGQHDLLPHQNKCIVHILDLNINMTKEYLLSAWSSSLFGSQNFYLVNVKDHNQLMQLNFSQLYDFQRIAIVQTSKVSTMFHIKIMNFDSMTTNSSNI